LQRDREHLTKTVWPALKKGIWVISDRFVDSSHAYQGSAKNSPGSAVVNSLYKQIAGDFQPDLTLLLDVPVATSMARVKARGGWNDRYQLKPAPFHRQLRASYLALAKKHVQRFKIIDAGKGVDAVAQEIAGTVQKHFRVKS